MRTASTPRRLRAAFPAVLVLAGLTAAAGAREGQAPPPSQTQPRAAPPKQERPALSPEDAALVQQLALVEHVELLRHLELFEREPAAPPKKRQ